MKTDLRDATQQVADVDQGGLGLHDRDYYLKTDARSLELKQKYQSHVQKMLGMLKTSPDRAESDARATLAIETTLAQAALDRTARRDPAATDHMMTKAEWQALTPDIDWAKYLAAAGAPSFARINVSVTLVYGDKDWSRPSDRQADIESVPGARDLVLRETGHFAALEAPDEVARILLEDGP